MSVVDQVQAHLIDEFGPETGRAAVSFVGVEPIEILRFGPASDGPAAGLVRYATLGMSRRPMTDPGATVLHGGPRVEVVLTLRGGRDEVSGPLAVLAAMPAVEGVVVAPGATYDLGGPLWPGGEFTGVLVGGPVLAELPTIDQPVRFLGLDPITALEQAYKRVHGPDALRSLWEDQGLDPRDPRRAPARLP